jgi:glycosyltransferase involved in cell wall biosynthesis
MFELDELPISVVIPTYNNHKSFEKVLDALCKQTIRPKQIVIIDSSDDNDIEINLHEYNNKIEIVYKKIERSFPGGARNQGVEIASEKYLAFLDSKTIPNGNWLSSSFAMLKDYDVVLGSVHYKGVSNYQKLISASIYGEDSIEHISGTVVSKTVFLNIGFFNEKSRAGEDLDWKTRLKESEFNYYFPAKANSVYSEIPGNLIFHMKRAFIYQMHSAFLDIQYSTRVLYLSVFLILLATLVPNWNNIVWQYNYELFVPNITKFFLFFLGLFIFISFIYLKIFGYFKQRRFLIFLMNLSLFIWLFVVVYNWNAAIAVSDESSPFFVPHITKVYLVSLLVLSFIARGIVFPIKRKVHKKYLFPYRWVGIGIIGLILDIAKSPGYFMGALIVVYKKLKFQFKDRKTDNKE